MKRLLAILVLIALTIGQSWSQPNTPPDVLPEAHSVSTNTPSSWSVSAGTIIMSEYYGTIFGGTFYNGPMSFTDLTAVYKNRWGNLIPTVMVGQKLDRLNTYNVDGGTEYDIGVNQTFTFGSKAYPILVNVGIMYLVVTDVEKPGDDFFDETIRVDLPIRADRPDGPIITPYAQIFHYHVIGDDLRDEGWIGYVGLIRDQRLGIHAFGKELKLNFDYRCGINFGVLGSQKGIEYHRLAVSLPVQYKKWTFTPSIIGQLQGDSGQTYVQGNKVFGTLSIRYSF